MPESQYRHRRLISPLRLSLLAGLALFFVSACYQDSEPPRQFVPGDALYEQFTTSGDRVLIEDPERGTTLKVRQRRRDTRVYNENMLPVGRITVDDDSGEVTRHTMDGLSQETIAVDDDQVTLSGAWRLEKAGEARWDLFDDEGRLIGLWRRQDDDRWTLRLTDDSAASYRAEIDEMGVARVVDRRDEPRLEARVGDWSEVKLLALSIEEISALDRYALAMWVDGHLDER